jgi:hypothetical protein
LNRKAERRAVMRTDGSRANVWTNSSVSPSLK